MAEKLSKTTIPLEWHLDRARVILSDLDTEIVADYQKLAESEITLEDSQSWIEECKAKKLHYISQVQRMSNADTILVSTEASCQSIKVDHEIERLLTLAETSARSHANQQKVIETQRKEVAQLRKSLIEKQSQRDKLKSSLSVIESQLSSLETSPGSTSSFGSDVADLKEIIEFVNNKVRVDVRANELKTNTFETPIQRESFETRLERLQSDDD